MVLKPEPHTAVLVQERVREVLAQGSLSEPEHVAMEEFERELEHYLE